MWSVYVLYSDAFDKRYTGVTSDMEMRLLYHNSCGDGWTARFRPWRVIYTKEFADRKQAFAYEKWLKTGVGRDFIKTIPH